MKLVKEINGKLTELNVPEGFREATEEDLAALESQKAAAAAELAERKRVVDLKRQINELKKKLAETDYQAIKYSEGELSEEEYAEMRVTRRSWRAQINDYENQIGEGANA